MVAVEGVASAFENGQYPDLHSLVLTIKELDPKDELRALSTFMTIVLKKWANDSYKENRSLEKLCIDLSAYAFEVLQRSVVTDDENTWKVLSFAVSTAGKSPHSTNVIRLLKAVHEFISINSRTAAKLSQFPKLVVQFVQACANVSSKLRPESTIGGEQLISLTEALTNAISTDCLILVDKAIQPNQVQALLTFVVDSFWILHQKCLDTKGISGGPMQKARIAVFDLVRTRSYISLARSVDMSLKTIVALGKTEQISQAADIVKFWISFASTELTGNRQQITVQELTRLVVLLLELTQRRSELLDRTASTGDSLYTALLAVASICSGKSLAAPPEGSERAILQASALVCAFESSSLFPLPLNNNSKKNNTVAAVTATAAASAYASLPALKDVFKYLDLTCVTEVSALEVISKLPLIVLKATTASAAATGSTVAASKELLALITNSSTARSSSQTTHTSAQEACAYAIDELTACCMRSSTANANTNRSTITTTQQQKQSESKQPTAGPGSTSSGTGSRTSLLLSRATIPCLQWLTKMLLPSRPGTETTTTTSSSSQTPRKKGGNDNHHHTDDDNSISSNSNNSSDGSSSSASSALSVICSIMNTLSHQRLWGPDVLPVAIGILRSAGNLLKLLPLTAFSSSYHNGGAAADDDVVNEVSRTLAAAVSNLFPSAPSTSSDSTTNSPAGVGDVISTCLSLASLVGAKMANTKNYEAACRVIAATLARAAAAAAASGGVTAGGGGGAHQSFLSYTDIESCRKLVTTLIQCIVRSSTTAAVATAAAVPVDVHSADDQQQQEEEQEKQYCRNMVDACRGVLQCDLLAIPFTSLLATDVFDRSSDPTTSFSVSSRRRLFALLLSLLSASVHTPSSASSTGTSSAVANSAVQDRNKIILRLWIESNIFWLSNKNVGPADKEAMSIINQLKEVAVIYDTTGIVNEVEVLKGNKSKSKRLGATATSASTAPSKPLTIDGNATATAAAASSSSLDSLASQLKLWMLLSQWASPVSIIAEDRRESDGTKGSTLYLKNATAAAVSLCDQISMGGGSGLSRLPVCVLHTLATDTKILYHTLALHGRTNDQTRLLRSLQGCGCLSIFTDKKTSPADVTNRPPPIHGGDPICATLFVSNVLKVISELSMHHEISCLWNGLSSPIGNGKSSSPSLQSQSNKNSLPTKLIDKENARPNSNKADGTSSSGSGRVSDPASVPDGWRECMKQLSLSPSSLAEEPTTATATVMEVIRIATHTLYTISYGEDGSQPLDNLAESVWSSKIGAGSSSSSSPSMSITLRSWTLLLVAKVMLIMGDHAIAFKWARRGLGLVNSSTTGSSSSTSSSSSSESGSGSSGGSGSGSSGGSGTGSGSGSSGSGSSGGSGSGTGSGSGSSGSGSSGGSGSGTGSGSSSGPPRLSSDTTLCRLEGVLLVAELYEQTGNVESCLSYVSEALSIAKLGSRALSNIVSLHCARIWRRVGSSRFVSALLDLTNKDEYSIEETVDDVSRSVRSAASTLSSLLRLMDDDDHGRRKPAAAMTVGDVGKSLSFRWLHRSWAIEHMLGLLSEGGGEQEEKDSNNKESKDSKEYSANISPELLACMNEFIATARKHLKSSPRLYAINAAIQVPAGCEGYADRHKMKSEEIQQLLTLLKPSLSFDILRDGRRAAASACIATGGLPFFSSSSSASTTAATSTTASTPSSSRTSMRALHAFVVGISSCSTALECIMEKQSTNGTDQEQHADLIAIAHTIRNACAGDEHCLNKISGSLDAVSASAAVAFMAIDTPTGGLLLGRYDATGAHVVSLPIADKVSVLVDDWEDCMQKMKAQLQRTMDPTIVQNWSEDDKRDWWTERQQFDSRIEGILRKLQKSLGPWSCMLSAGGSAAGGSDADGGKGNSTSSSNSSWADDDTMSLTSTTLGLSKLSIQSSSSSSSSCKSAMMKKSSSSSRPASSVPVNTAAQQAVEVPRGSSFAEALEAVATHCSSAAEAYTDNEAALQDTTAVTADTTTAKKADAVAVAIAMAMYKEIDELKVTDLRKRLKDLGLSTIGKKSELVDRLVAALVPPIPRPQATSSSSPSLSSPVEAASSPTPATATTGTDTVTEKKTQETAATTSTNAAEIPVNSSKAATEKKISSTTAATKLKTTSKAKPRSVAFADDDVDVAATPTDTTATPGDVRRVQPVSTSSSSSSSHIILVLDERLQMIPLESMPCLHDKSCSRVPSFSLLLNLLKKDNQSKQSKHVSVKKSWYVVDPESNLPGTRETMRNFLSPYAQQWNWPGSIATMPTADFVRNNHTSSELFIYCGHGTGDKMCDTYKFRKWEVPAAMLWGCSSGRLATQGVHDPSGAVLNYLIGGAPFVIANLWDVTDRDIDRLSVDCMKRVFDSATASRNSGSSACKAGGENHDTESVVGAAVAASRDVCKLKSAVGSAAVLYGLPVSITSN